MTVTVKTPIGPITGDTVWLGEDYSSQTITVVNPANALGGTFYLRYKRYGTAAIAITASAADLQTAIRTLPDWEDAVVEADGAYNWNVESHSATSILGLLIADDTFGDYIGDLADVPYVRVANGGVARPLAYWLVQETYPRATSVSPFAGRGILPGTGGDRASETRVSQAVLQNLLGGLGVFNYKEQERMDVFWDSKDCFTFIDRQITLGALKYSDRTTTPYFEGDGPTFTSFLYDPIYLLNKTVLNDTLYGVFACNNGADALINQFASYNPTTNTWTNITPVTAWSTSNSGRVVDILVYKGDIYFTTGTTRLWRYNISAGLDYATTTSGAAAPSGTTYKPMLLEVWNDQLYCFQTDGSMWFSTDSATSKVWTQNGQFPEEVTGATSLLAQMRQMKVWRDSKLQSAIWLLHTRGLWRYVPDTGQFVRDQVLTGTTDAYPTKSMAVYNSNLVFVANNTVYQFDGANISNMGPMNNDGLPYQSTGIGSEIANDGRVTALEAINNWLFCSYGQTTTDAWTLDQSSFSDETILSSGSDINLAGMVLGYLSGGWSPVVGWFTDINQDLLAQWGGVFWHDDKLFFHNAWHVRFSDAVGNPINWTQQTYAQKGYLVSSWFDRNLSEVLKIAYQFEGRFSGLSSTEKVTIYYQIDGAPDGRGIGRNPRQQWVQLYDEHGNPATVDSDRIGGSSGSTSLYFDRHVLADGSAHSRGIAFLKIRLMFIFERDDDPSAATRTPVLEAGSISFDGRFDPLSAWECRLDISRKSPDGRAPERQLADIIETYESQLLNRFSYSPYRNYQTVIDYYRSNGIRPGYRVAERGPGAEVGVTVSQRLLL